jgi:hypothetical protein
MSAGKSCGSCAIDPHGVRFAFATAPLAEIVTMRALLRSATTQRRNTTKEGDSGEW